MQFSYRLLKKIRKILDRIPSSLYQTDFLRMQERTMFKRIELALSIIIVFLLLFRFVFGTALNALLLPALVLQAIHYMWFGFFLFSRVSLRDLATPKSRSQVSVFMVISSIIMGILYSISIIAIVYGIFFYTGMNYILIVSVLFLFSATAITIFYHWLNEADRPLLSQYYKRSAILGIFCFMLWVTPVDLRLEVLFRKHPDFIEAYRYYRENPQSEEAKNRMSEARSYFR